CKRCEARRGSTGHNEADIFLVDFYLLEPRHEKIMRRRPNTGYSDLFANEILRLAYIFNGHEHPRREFVEIEDDDERETGDRRQDPGGKRREKIDIPAHDCLRLDAGIHLNTFCLETALFEQPFLLCHVKGHVG